MDSVTAVSGSGPAYFFLLIEAIEDAAVALGLPRDTARQLSVQTALGSARMAAEGSEPPERLRAQVTSKGGTTAAALAVLESADLRGIFSRAITAAACRSAELADQFGTD
jgi:pyrroline-5-carboxylate reductase